MSNLHETADGVLFPVITELVLAGPIGSFLDRGGKALLLGETAEAMTCDLDHRATMRAASLPDTAVRALQAGADLLLISPAGAQLIPEIVAAIVAAVQQERLSMGRLQASARAVRRLATGGIR